MMDNKSILQSKARLLIIITLVIGLGFVVFRIGSALQNRGKIAVAIKTAPKQALTTINGKKVNGGANLSPGTYTLEVSYTGFNNYTQKFEVKSGDSKHILTASLDPKTAAAEKIADAQQARYAELEALSGQQSQADSATFFDTYPLLRNLPAKTSYYSIDYGKNASGGVVVQITASQPLGRQVALEKIRSWGYDPTDYDIVFTGLANPFAAGSL